MEGDHLKISKDRSSHSFRTVIFDFDYTLADSSKGVVESINFALNELGFPKAKPEEISNTIESSLEETFLASVGQQHITKCEEFRRLFIKKADKVMADLTFVYELVPSVVQDLRNDVSKPKPNPEGLLKICRKLRDPPAKSLYVGDTLTDAETARRAGIPFIAVLSGVTPQENFSEYHVYKIITNLNQLPNIIVGNNVQEDFMK
jgi:phosphoglycolate phosphatase